MGGGGYIKPWVTFRGCGGLGGFPAVCLCFSFSFCIPTIVPFELI